MKPSLLKLKIHKISNYLEIEVSAPSSIDVLLVFITNCNSMNILKASITFASLLLSLLLHLQT